MKFKAITALDKFFEIGILLKAIDGVLEVIGGILLLTVNTDTISHLAYFVTRYALSKDPDDLLANYVLNSVAHLSHGSLLFGALYLLSHGIVKIILVAEILRNRLWAYQGLIVVTIAFMFYQSYRFVHTHEISMILLTLYDGVVVWLTLVEYRKRKLKMIVPDASVVQD
jgi:uncharacterized membrane protein